MYKPAYEDVEWLKDYCNTLRSIANDNTVPYVERQECRMKLHSTLEQIRKLENNKTEI